MQCTIWRYLEKEPPLPYTDQMLTEVAQKAGGAERPVLGQHQTIWIGGQKPGLLRAPT